MRPAISDSFEGMNLSDQRGGSVQEGEGITAKRYHRQSWHLDATLRLHNEQRACIPEVTACMQEQREPHDMKLKTSA